MSNRSPILIGVLTAGLCGLFAWKLVFGRPSLTGLTVVVSEHINGTGLRYEVLELPSRFSMPGDGGGNGEGWVMIYNSSDTVVAEARMSHVELAVGEDSGRVFVSDRGGWRYGGSWELTDLLSK